MKTANTITIAKRDGSQEPFSPAKLRRVVALAMQACGYDRKLADPLVQAVEVHLQYWEEPHLPTSEYVARCVNAVLKQTGLHDVRECVAAHRRWRRVRRRAVQVARPVSKRGLRPWRKNSLIAMLKKRYDVGHAVARIVAGEIELRVLNLGFSVISHALLEELVRNELAAWGLLVETDGRVRRQGPGTDRRRAAG